MAQTIIKQNERLSVFLRGVTAEVEFLPTLETLWGEFDNEQKVLVWLDWEHLMGDYLTELEEEYDKSAMTDEQAAEYRRLLALINENLPIFERLEMPRPMVRLSR